MRAQERAKRGENARASAPQLRVRVPHRSARLRRGGTLTRAQRSSACVCARAAQRRVRLRAHLGHGGELVQEGLDGVFVQQSRIRFAALEALRLLLLRRLARGKPASEAPLSATQVEMRVRCRNPHFWLYADTLFPVDVSACLISAMRAAESAIGAERSSCGCHATWRCDYEAAYGAATSRAPPPRVCTPASVSAFADAELTVRGTMRALTALCAAALYASALVHAAPDAGAAACSAGACPLLDAARLRCEAEKVMCCAADATLGAAAARSPAEEATARLLELGQARLAQPPGGRSQLMLCSSGV
jgi:hypothetical protein